MNGNGFVIPYIRRYLDGTREFDEAILKDHAQGVINALASQLMKDRQEKEGGTGFYASSATKCVRQNYWKMAGASKDPREDDWTNVKFAFGDLSEVLMMVLTQLAYKGTPHDVGQWNARIDVKIGGEKRNGYIDALIAFNHSYHEREFGCRLYTPEGKYLYKNDRGEWCEDLVIEGKAMHSYPFEKAQKEGLDDIWGYLGQMAVYQRSLRLHRGVFVLLNRESGEMAEQVIPYSKEKALQGDMNFATVKAALEKGEPPPIPFDRQPEMDRRDGLLASRFCGFCDYLRTCMAHHGYRVEKVKKTIKFMKQFDKDLLKLMPLDGSPVPIPGFRSATKRVAATLDTSVAVMERKG